MVGADDRARSLQRSRESGQEDLQDQQSSSQNPALNSASSRISGNSGIFFAIGFVLDASSFVIVMSGLVLLICNGVVISRKKNADLSFRPKHLPFFCGTLFLVSGITGVLRARRLDLVPLMVMSVLVGSISVVSTLATLIMASNQMNTAIVILLTTGLIFLNLSLFLSMFISFYIKSKSFFK